MISSKTLQTLTLNPSPMALRKRASSFSSQRKPNQPQSKFVIQHFFEHHSQSQAAAPASADVVENVIKISSEVSKSVPQAELYRVRKAFEKAEPLYLEAITILAITILEASFGPDDMCAGAAPHNLEQFYLAHRKLDQAHACYEDPEGLFPCIVDHEAAGPWSSLESSEGGSQLHCCCFWPWKSRACTKIFLQVAKEAKAAGASRITGVDIDSKKIDVALFIGFSGNLVLAEKSSAIDNDQELCFLAGLRRIENGLVISNSHTSKWRIFSDNGRELFLKARTK